MGRGGVAPAPRFEGYAPSSTRASMTARAIGRTETRAEIELRRALWKRGLRYRKNVATLPGRPDIVFPRARLVVFVDGDFWHGRDWEARLAKLKRGSNAPYWVAKIGANIERDRRKTEALRAMGYEVVRVWETDVLRDPAAAAGVIAGHVAAPIARASPRPATLGRAPAAAPQ